MVQKYEILMLTVPEITQDESKQIEKEVDRVVTAAKGSVISLERWGKYRLVYPVRSNEYGVYFLIRYEIEKADAAALNQALRDLCAIKLNTIIMRHIISRIEAGTPLVYQRPKSLEEMPTSRDMNSFLKENQMEGLLYSVDAESGSEELKK